MDGGPKMPPMRILSLPSNPADQAGILTRALRAQGYEAEMWHFGAPPFGFQADRIIDVDQHDPSVIWPHFAEAIGRFDVFHFWFGRTFFSHGWKQFPPFWDLPVLRMLGKRIIFTFVGSECRTRDVMEMNNPFTSLFYETYAPDENKIRADIEVISRYADRLLAMTEELKPYVPGSTYIPRAFPLASWPEQDPNQREVPVIVHVPSRRALKGTDQIVAGMAALKDEGLAFDFRLYEDIPHAELIDLCRDADVVIDNIVMGDHGISSVEAMASSRVAVAYLIDPVKEACPGIPIYEADPNSFVDRMRALIRDRGLRSRLASEGRPYVAANWNDVDVAKLHIDIYAGSDRERPARSFPGWVAAGGDRRIEKLESSLDRRILQSEELAAEVRDLRAQNSKLRKDLAAARTWSPKDMLPPSVRRALRRRGR